MRTEFGVCEVPAEHHGWEEPLPTLRSWEAAASIGIKHVRMNYQSEKIQFFDPAFRLARDGGMRITANMTIGDLDSAHPDTIEVAAFGLVTRCGSDLESVSFENEPGGKPGMSPQASRLDISQGGKFDWIASVYAPLLLAFMRGARRANPHIRFDLFDADSTDAQQRCMELLIGTEFENDPNIYWTGHNYADVGGDPAGGNPGGQDYSSMAGMNAKPGFLNVFQSDRLRRDWYISEISKATGQFGGIATPSDMDVMIRYTGMMLTKYPQCRKIDFLSAKYFFERVPAPPGVPPGTWCTWTFGEPIVSAQGRAIAAAFRPVRRRATRK